MSFLPQRMRDNKPKSELRQALSSFSGTFAYVGLFSFFVNLLMLVPPLYMLQVYDRVMVSRSESTLLMLTLIVVVLFITMALLEMIRSRIMIRVGGQLSKRVGDRIFDAMFMMSLTRSSQNQGQPLEDLKQLSNFLAGKSLFALFDLPWVPIYIALLYLFHPIYGHFAIGAAILLTVLAFVNEWVTKKPLRDANSTAIMARDIAATQTRNAEVVQAMGMMDRLRNRWQGTYDQYLGHQGTANERSSLWTSFSKAFRMLAQSMMLGLGGLLAIRLEVTAGMIIAGSIILGRALAPLDLLIASWKQLSGARSAYARLDALLAEFPLLPVPMSLPAPKGEVRVEGVVLVPPGAKRPVLRGVGFELDAGEALGIVGPSGAGKSSLARGLLSVWPLTSGKVRLDGADVAQWNRIELGPHIGYLPQDIELFAGTAAENIARFGEVDATRVVEAAKLVGVHQMILELADGYDTQIGAGGSVLSGGQRQRIALARAVYGNPRLLVLDEPNSSLDEQGEASLLTTIDAIKASGATVILISHRPGILVKMDKVLVLKDGSVARFGTRDEVLPLLLPDYRPPAAPRQPALSSPQGSPGALA